MLVNRSLAWRLRIICNSTMTDRFLLWAMRRLKAFNGAFTKDLEDIRMLKQRLQVSAKVVF